MRTPLLSFLTDFENALLADDPAPEGGSWVTQRSVNYQRGLARLELAVRGEQGLTERGQVLLQGYQLADGTPCLKAMLSWAGSSEQRVCSYFYKAGISWRSEARKAAAEWMGGPVATSEAGSNLAEPALAVG
jgi:hypothetical protein